MPMEKEFLAMRKIDKAFSMLDPTERNRVVAWAADKFNSQVLPQAASVNRPVQSSYIQPQANVQHSM